MFLLLCGVVSAVVVGPDPVAAMYTGLHKVFASRNLLQKQTDVTSIFMVDFDSVLPETLNAAYGRGTGTGPPFDIAVEEFQVKGQVNVSVPEKEGLIGSYALSSSEAKQVVDIVQSEVPTIPAAEATVTTVAPDGIGLGLEGNSVLAAGAGSKRQPLRVATIFDPFRAGHKFVLSSTNATQPPIIMHMTNFTLLVANSSYGQLQMSGIMDFFELGDRARVCLSDSEFMLQSCDGFSGDFNMWCCTRRQCNIEYTRQAVEDLGFDLSTQATQFLRCTPLVPWPIAGAPAAADAGQTAEVPILAIVLSIVGAVLVCAMTATATYMFARRKVKSHDGRARKPSQAKSLPATGTATESHIASLGLRAVTRVTSGAWPRSEQAQADSHGTVLPCNGTFPDSLLIETGLQAGAATRQQALEDALEALRHGSGVFFNTFQVLGSAERRSGGQGCVQFMADPTSRRDVAVKFFFQRAAFDREAALYADRSLQGLMVATRAVCANDGAGGTAVIASAGGYVFPPFVIIERGESLEEFCWLARMRVADGEGDAEDLHMTLVQAIVFVAARVLRMHEAGWAHRDLKPSNILRLPREHSWTLIDFGCAARIGTAAALEFTLAYAAPEVVMACVRGEHTTPVTDAVDVWAMGLIAFELLAGCPVFPLGTAPAVVIASLAGQAEFPWEGPDRAELLKKLGVFKGSVLDCLCRDAANRPKMKTVLLAWRALFVAAATQTSTTGAAPPWRDLASLKDIEF